MFTGIVQETGVVERVRPTAKAIELTIRTRLTGRGLKVGDSLAVNGCCLTAVKVSTRGKFRIARFDLLQETWRRTNLQFVKPGSLVNLERPLRANAELGGHFVTGHIDGIGKIVRWERAGQDHVLDITAPRDVLRYVVFKGSIAVDGISLTVASLTKGAFEVALIPHTLENTNLRTRQIGDEVNLECDVLAKYVESMLKQRENIPAKSRLTEQYLKDRGY